MSRSPFRPPAARKAAPRATVQDWRAALELAPRLADTAERDEAAYAGLDGFAGDVARLRLMVRDITADSFPAASDPARLAAGAFLNAARAFSHLTATPQSRTACAPMLREAARGVDRLLTLHQTAQAQGTWARGQFGDD